MADLKPMQQSGNTLIDLMNLITAGANNFSGSSTTQTTSDSGISQDAMNAMLKSLLEGTSGLADVASGQNRAGMYGSSVNTQLVNDLMTRAAAQVAANGPKSQTTTTKTAPKVAAGGAGQLLALAQVGSKVWKGGKDLANWYEGEGGLDGIGANIQDFFGLGSNNSAGASDLSDQLVSDNPFGLGSSNKSTASSSSNAATATGVAGSSAGASPMADGSVSVSENLTAADYASTGSSVGAAGTATSGAFDTAFDADVASGSTTSDLGTTSGESTSLGSAGQALGYAAAANNSYQGIKQQHYGATAGAIVGGIVGSFYGNPAGGAAIGSKIGGWEPIDSSVNTDVEDVHQDALSLSHDTGDVFNDFSSGDVFGGLDNIGQALLDPLQGAYHDIGDIVENTSHIASSVAESVGDAINSLDDGCFITTAVCEQFGWPDDCAILKTLRAFRDNFMKTEGELAQFVEQYYSEAPEIVRIISEFDPLSKADVYILMYEEFILPAVREIEQGNNYSAFGIYKELFEYAYAVAYGTDGSDK